MATKFQTQQFTNSQHVVRCSVDTLIIDNEIIDYGKQCLLSTDIHINNVGPDSSLTPPIVLQNTKQIDALDRRIFSKRFILEIVKCLQMCSIEDAIFIFKRVPKVQKYYASILQEITLARWNMLLSSNQFFLVLFQEFQKLISKKQMSELRVSILQENINTKITKPFQRLFYMFDNLVLISESIRNSLLCLNRRLILEEMEKKSFFEKVLMNNYKDGSQTQDSEDNNSDVQGNKAQIFEKPGKQIFIESFLSNSVKAIRSCQRLKISKQTIVSKILNVKFFQILKQHFKQYFQTQRLLLLQILSQASEIQPIQLWKITFQEGRTIRCKNLKYLQVLLTNTMINYSNSLKQNKKLKNKSQSKPIKKSKIIQQVNESHSIEQSKQNFKEEAYLHSWQFSLIILDKFVTFQSPQRKKFCDNVVNSLLSCKLIAEELEFILNFLEFSQIDLIYQKKDIPIWKNLLLKIQNFLQSTMNKKQINKNVLNNKNQQQKQQKSLQLQYLNTEFQTSDIIQQSQTNIEPFDRKIFHLHVIKLPFSKVIIILLMKIYKILIRNEARFELSLNRNCIFYVLQVTKKCKGIIQGVRNSLIIEFGRQNKQTNIETQDW